MLRRKKKQNKGMETDRHGVGQRYAIFHMVICEGVEQKPERNEVSIRKSWERTFKNRRKSK